MFIALSYFKRKPESCNTQNCQENNYTNRDSSHCSGRKCLVCNPNTWIWNRYWYQGALWETHSQLLVVEIWQVHPIFYCSCRSRVVGEWRINRVVGEWRINSWLWGEIGGLANIWNLFFLLCLKIRAFFPCLWPPFVARSEILEIHRMKLMFLHRSWREFSEIHSLLVLRLSLTISLSALITSITPITFPPNLQIH